MTNHLTVSALFFSSLILPLAQNLPIDILQSYINVANWVPSTIRNYLPQLVVANDIVLLVISVVVVNVIMVGLVAAILWIVNKEGYELSYTPAFVWTVISCCVFFGIVPALVRFKTAEECCIPDQEYRSKICFLANVTCHSKYNEDNVKQVLRTSVQGQKYQVETVLQYVNAHHKNRARGPLCLIFTGEHGRGKTLISKLLAEVINDISLCNVLVARNMYSSVANCHQARGYLYKSMNSDFSTSNFVDEVQHFVNNKQNRGFTPIITLDEMQFAPQDFSNFFLPLINGNHFYKNNKSFSFDGGIIIGIINNYLLDPTNDIATFKAHDLDKLLSQNIQNNNYEPNQMTNMLPDCLYNFWRNVLEETNMTKIISNTLTHGSVKMLTDKCTIIPFSPHTKESLRLIYSSIINAEMNMIANRTNITFGSFNDFIAAQVSLISDSYDEKHSSARSVVAIAEQHSHVLLAIERQLKNETCELTVEFNPQTKCTRFSCSYKNGIKQPHNIEFDCVGAQSFIIRT
jgi:Torsin